MPFIKFVITEYSWQKYWRKFSCSECGHEFKVGEKVYSQFKGGAVKSHLCEACYNAKFVEV